MKLRQSGIAIKTLLRTSFAILFVLLCASNSMAQLPDTVWTRIYDAELGDSCRYFPAIAATPDTGPC
ncbi:MAG: hypothetical protein IPP40_16920 [bacterium]|nr:hypothetical protein [bacterium]